MKLIILSLLILSLAACGVSRTRVNPNGDLAAYEADPEWFWYNCPRKYGTRVLGCYDHEDGSVTWDRTLSPIRKMLVFNHEVMGHAWDHQKPEDGWALMARYHDPVYFPLLTHPQEEIDQIRAYADAVPDPLEVKRAMDAAKEAAR